MCLANEIWFVINLLLGLSLLHNLPAHFDAGGEDGTGEVGHIDALQVAHLLSSCVNRENPRIRGNFRKV